VNLSERLPALGHREFRVFLTGSFVSNVGTQIHVWAIAWQIYALTGSSLMVGLLGLVRVVPLLLFSLIGGVIADQVDRRRVQIVTQAVMMCVAATIFGLTWTGTVSITWLYLLVGIGSVARAFEAPARQSMVASLVPREHFPNAASLNGIAWRLSDVLGPVFAGLLIGSSSNGLAYCYLVNALTFLSVIFALNLLPPKPPLEEGESVRRVKTIADAIGMIREGIVFVRGTDVVRNAMWIDFWATLFSGAEALIPAMSTKILGLGPEGYGILAGSTAVGALVAATIMAWAPTIVNQGRWVILMIGCYGLFTIGFALSTNLLMASAFLAAVGASDMVSTVLRQTIRQLATPDHMRGRMSAISALFHISGPQLGDFEAGVAASITGERTAIAIGGVMCMAIAGRYSRVRSLRDYRHL